MVARRPSGYGPEVKPYIVSAPPLMYKKLLNAKPSPDRSLEHVHWTAAAASRK
jgi:hypothetical protein